MMDTFLISANVAIVFILVAALVSIGFGIYNAICVYQEDISVAQLDKEVEATLLLTATKIENGAYAFLTMEYMYLGSFVAVMAVIIVVFPIISQHIVYSGRLLFLILDHLCFSLGCCHLYHVRLYWNDDCCQYQLQNYL
jgi:Na+/H+-translocating membrane pyrophosphatase